jgi:pilus assembly protein Flp/PilA
MTSWFATQVHRFFNSDNEGQGLAEYALILALIAIIAIVALIFLGGQVSQILSNVGHSV